MKRCAKSAWLAARVIMMADHPSRKCLTSQASKRTEVDPARYDDSGVVAVATEAATQDDARTMGDSQHQRQRQRPPRSGTSSSSSMTTAATKNNSKPKQSQSSSSSNSDTTFFYAMCLFFVAFFVAYGFGIVFLSQSTGAVVGEGTDSTTTKQKNNGNAVLLRTKATAVTTKTTPAAASLPAPKLLSRLSPTTGTVVKATSDVRGNLGEASVVLQDPPGTDWLKDRWQAASNMHGQNIPGAHWVQLEFVSPSAVCVTKVVLDWEAAYATDYVLEGSLASPLPVAGENPGEDRVVLYDGGDASQDRMRTVESSGRSPGVNSKTPLHYVHTIRFPPSATVYGQREGQGRDVTTGDDGGGVVVSCKDPVRFLRVYIRKPASHGWGVSLWQFDVYGYKYFDGDSNNNNT